MRAIELICPRCHLLVIVHAGRIEEHYAMFGRIVRGARVCDRCPASGQSYIRLLTEVSSCAL